MDLTISGIQLLSGGGQLLPVTASVRLDTWQHWLLIACDNVASASEQEARLHEAISRDDDAAKGDALEAEFRPAMTALSACAFAIDAFYATVIERMGAHPDRDKWRDKRLTRHRQIAETLRYHFKYKAKGMPVVNGVLEELFRFRDRAVHPPAAFREPIYRADLDAGVEPRFVTFSAKHSRQALGLTLELFVATVPKLEAVAKGDLIRWAVFVRQQTEQVCARAAAIEGVSVPDAVAAAHRL